MRRAFGTLCPVLVMLLCPAVSLACGCYQLDPNQTAAQAVREARNSAAAVFLGKVVEVGERRRDSEGYYAVVRFKVERSWKGADSAEVLLTSRLNDCAFPFKAGGTYLVYASLTGRGELDASVCSRTRRLERAGADLKLLGRAKRRKRA